MRYTFIELSAFSKYRSDYFTDEEFRRFQQELLLNPRLGAVIKDTGGLRKVRWSDPKRGKGKRGGSRTIYYVFDEGGEIWLFTVYGKDVQDDLDAQQRATLKRLLEDEKALRI